MKMITGNAGQLIVDCSTEYDDQFSLVVFSLSGNKIIGEELLLLKGITRKELNLQPGMYICELRNRRGEAVQQKAIVH